MISNSHDQLPVPLSIEQQRRRHSVTMTMTDRVSFSLALAVVCSLVALRVLVGFQPHSGQDNHHGSKVAYGGDYEAQRHWMELTLHLPIGDWYWFDLQYWGLDYPPLTAYVSWLCGIFSSWLVSAESVALNTSRGYEDPTHKAYMRGTVLALDVLVYMSVIWIASKRSTGQLSLSHHNTQSLWTLILGLAQPALVLIDHGHFQYNTVSLGFALWGFYHVTKPSFSGCLIGSVWFCLALNFKQMTLYYAPAIFAYLLGRCFRSTPNSSSSSNSISTTTVLNRFCLLGGTVILVFAAMWWPFLYFPPSQTVLPTATEVPTPLERFFHVLHRIFPLQRGLFEGKVSNLWCALSVKPFSIRERLPGTFQPVAALGMTFLLMMPACIRLFRVGQGQVSIETASTSTTPTRTSNIDNSIGDWEALLWGSASTGLAFFLASFQVHEKSILMPLAPLTLLLWKDFSFVNWFGVVAAWTLWPLLCVDRLQTAYFCTIAIFLSLVWMCRGDKDSTKTLEGHRLVGFFGQHWILQTIVPLSSLGMAGLHMLELVVEPPAHLQDLFPVLWSVAGCGMFVIGWAGTCWHLYEDDTTKQMGDSRKEHTD